MPTKWLVVGVLLSFNLIVALSEESGEGENEDEQTLSEAETSGDFGSGEREQGTPSFVKAPPIGPMEKIEIALNGESETFNNFTRLPSSDPPGWRISAAPGKLEDAHFVSKSQPGLHAYLSVDPGMTKNKRTFVPKHQHGVETVSQKSSHEVDSPKFRIPTDHESIAHEEYRRWTSKLNQVVKKDSFYDAVKNSGEIHVGSDGEMNAETDVTTLRSTIRKGDKTHHNISQNQVAKRRSDALEPGSKSLPRTKASHTEHPRKKFFVSSEVLAKQTEKSLPNNAALSKTSRIPASAAHDDANLEGPAVSLPFNPASFLSEAIGKATEKSYRPAIVPNDEHEPTEDGVPEPAKPKKKLNLHELVGFLPTEGSPPLKVHDASDHSDSNSDDTNASANAAELQDPALIDVISGKRPKDSDEDDAEKSDLTLHKSEDLDSSSEPPLVFSQQTPRKGRPTTARKPGQEPFLSSPQRVSGFKPVIKPADSKPVISPPTLDLQPLVGPLVGQEFGHPEVSGLWNQPPPVANPHFQDVVNPGPLMMKEMQRENEDVQEELQQLQTRLSTLERTVMDIDSDVRKIQARLKDIEESSEPAKLTTPLTDGSELTTPSLYPLSALKQSMKPHHPRLKSVFVKLPALGSPAAMSIEKGNPIPLLPFPLNVIVSKIFRKMLQQARRKKVGEERFHPLHPLPDAPYPPLEHDINRLEVELGRIPHAKLDSPPAGLALADMPAAAASLALEADKDDDVKPERPEMKLLLEKPVDVTGCLRTCLNGGRCQLDGSCECPVMFAGSRCQHLRRSSTALMNVLNQLRAQEFEGIQDREKENLLSLPFVLSPDNSEEEDASHQMTMAQVDQGKLVDILSRIAGSKALFPQVRKRQEVLPFWHSTFRDKENQPSRRRKYIFL